MATSNTLITTDKLTRECTRLLHEKLTFVRSINRQYDNSFAKTGAKIGSTLRIRKPSKYVVTDGATLVKQPSIQDSLSLSVTSRKHVGLAFSTQDLTMDMDDLTKLHLEPAMSVLAAEIEADCIERAIKATYNLTGTWGTSPATLSPFLGARAKLNQGLAPKDNRRHALISSVTSIGLVEGLKTLTNDEAQIGKQYREGFITRAAGLSWAESESMYSHANGTQTMAGTVSATVAVNGTDKITLTGLGATKTVTVGSVFEVAGIYNLHPQTKQQRAHLQQFVVTAGGTSSAGGVLEVSVSPSMYFDADGRQNISGAPTATNVVTFVGVLSQVKEQSLVYHEDAFTFATADLILPRGAVAAHRETYDGISLRIIEGYDITDDECPTRVDVLYGFGVLEDGFACRVTS